MSLHSGLKNDPKSYIFGTTVLGYSGSDSYDINPVLLKAQNGHLFWLLHKSGDENKPASPEVAAILRRSKYPDPIRMDTAIFLGRTPLPIRKYQFKFIPSYNQKEKFGHPSKFVGRVLESICDYKNARSYYNNVIWNSTGSNYLMIEILDLFRHSAVCSFELKDYNAASGSLTMARILLMSYMTRLEKDTLTPAQLKKRILLDQYLLLCEEQALTSSALGKHDEAESDIQEAFKCLESLDWDINTKSSVKSRLLLNRCNIRLNSLEQGKQDIGEY